MRHENVKIIKLVIVKTQVIILRCLKVYDEILLQTIHASKISRQFEHARAFCLSKDYSISVSNSEDIT